MNVSIVNLNLEGWDAIGQSIVNQVQFFQRRGDVVQVYLEHEPRNVPRSVQSVAHVVGLEALLEKSESHFAQSELFVYHYPSQYHLLESMKALERGAVVFYYHNVTPPHLWGSDLYQDLLRESVANAGVFAHYADLVVTDSEFNATQLTEQYGIDRERIKVLALAVPLDRFAPGARDEALLKRYGLHGKRVVLFVGRMAGNKRINVLVEALARVRESLPNTILLLVGDDRSNLAIQDNVSAAIERARELGVADAVVFAGAVGDVAPYYRVADVYASASVHEGFGVPLVEAMASGLPVVASRATAHPWVLSEAGLLAEPDDPADMADKIASVLTDDALCGVLVERGLARAKEFSLEQYLNNWARIVAEATAWLPNRPYPIVRKVRRPQPETVKASDAPDEMELSADVMLRGYVVRSGLPVVGGLVAWIRRNLTSHLREPYVDPTFERQVAFNKRVARALRTISARLDATAAGTATRSSNPALEIELLSSQVARLELEQSVPRDAARIEELSARIEAIRRELAGANRGAS